VAEKCRAFDVGEKTLYATLDSKEDMIREEYEGQSGMIPIEKGHRFWYQLNTVNLPKVINLVTSSENAIGRGEGPILHTVVVSNGLVKNYEILINPFGYPGVRYQAVARDAGSFFVIAYGDGKFTLTIIRIRGLDTLEHWSGIVWKVLLPVSFLMVMVTTYQYRKSNDPKAEDMYPSQD
jgi:hypothetical protein